ncbi:DUF6879 family protein [Actinomadura sp. 3N508]|uniref:DUF6879 family protein n=1 Tax=Actinomadura sp. 3N508 TaxID=3375153 RepID=UPI00379F30E4
MELISAEQRKTLTRGAREVLKVELRDHYEVDAELLVAWRAGETEKLAASYESWRGVIEAETAKGWTFRRVRVVSEPLSDYQRMAVEWSGSAVDAGEELRWLPRRLVSAVALPGNDCFVIDGQGVIFNVLDADGSYCLEIQYSTDPDVVRYCRDAFAAAWALATPHHAFRAQMISA